MKHCRLCDSEIEDHSLNFKFACGHAYSLCTECIPQADEICPACNLNDQKHRNTCYICKSEDQSIESISITFAECRIKKCHEVKVCKSCLLEHNHKRHSTKLEDRICYLCTERLGDLFIEQKMKNCEGDHICNLCIECDKAFKNATNPPKCYICFPFDQSTKECSLCREEIEVNNYCNIRRCARLPHHKNYLCIDCASEVPEEIERYLGCKYCANRHTFATTIMYPTQDYQNLTCIPLISFADNTITESTYEVDTQTCPLCNPLTISSSLLNELENTSFVQFFLSGSSTCRVRDFFVLTGGYIWNGKTGRFESSSNTFAYTYIQDGRSKRIYMPGNIKPTLLDVPRHFHQSIFVESLNKLIVMGGVTFKPHRVLDYLDSIQTATISESGFQDLGNKTGKINWEEPTDLKLQRARASFNLVEYNGYLYAIGGFGGYNTIESSVEKIDLTNSTSTILDFTTPEGFVFPSSAVIINIKGAKFWLIGGKTNSEAATSEVYEIDLEKLTVIDTKNNMKRARSGHRGLKISAIDSSIIVVYGGDHREYEDINTTFEILKVEADGNSSAWMETNIKEFFQYGDKMNKISFSAGNIMFSSQDSFSFIQHNFDLLS